MRPFSSNDRGAGKFRMAWSSTSLTTFFTMFSVGISSAGLYRKAYGFSLAYVVAPISVKKAQWGTEIGHFTRNRARDGLIRARVREVDHGRRQAGFCNVKGA